MLPGAPWSSKAPLWGRFSLGDAAVFAALGLLAFSWMTTEHFLPWVSWHAEMSAFFAVVLLSWTAWARSLRGTLSVASVPQVAWPFALIAGLTLIQYATGMLAYRGDMLVVCFYMAACIACLTLGFNAPKELVIESQALRRWSPAEALAMVFVLGGLASTVVAFAQVLGLWEHTALIARMSEQRRPGGNLGQPNQLATLLVMAVASTGFLHAAGKVPARVAALLLVALCAGIAVTESRSGALGLATVLVWWQLKRSQVARQVSAWTAPGAGAIFLAMYIFWPKILASMDLLGGRIESRFGQGDIRFAMWSQLLEAALQRPWWGWGMAGVAKAHNAVADGYVINNPFTYSHNLAIDLIVWLGFPFAAILLIASGFWFWRRLRAADRLEPWYCLAVLLPLATHSMLEFPFAYVYFLAPVLFLVGVLERASGAPARLRIGSKPVLALLLVFSAGLAWSATEYLAIEEDFRIVRFEQLRLGNTPTDHHRPDVVMQTQLGALLTAPRIPLRPSMPDADLEEIRQLALRYPWAATQYRYALALALNGQRQEAVRQLQIIRWQRGENFYARLKGDLAELAQSRFPQLRDFVLP